MLKLLKKIWNTLTYKQPRRIWQLDYQLERATELWEQLCWENEVILKTIEEKAEQGIIEDMHQLEYNLGRIECLKAFIQSINEELDEMKEGIEE